MPIPQASIPNLNLAPPQIVDPLARAGQMASLRQMQGQNALLPLQMQEQQQKLQSGQLAIQQQQLELKSQQAMMDAWADPTFSSAITGNPPGASGAPTTSGPGFDPNGMVRELVKRGVLPAAAVQQANAFLELSKNSSAMTKDQLSNIKDSHDLLAKSLLPIPDLATPEEQDAALAVVKSKVSTGGFPGLDPTDAQLIGQADVSHLPAMLGVLGFHGDLLDYQTKQATEREAQQKAITAAQQADPVFKLSQPDELAKPGAQASIQALIDSPKTKPDDVPRLRALLPKAAVAQQNALDIKKREDLLQQTVSQGDPDVAGKLLASRTLTLDELKLRNATPQFMERAVTAATKYDPTFKAPEAAAQGAIAKSPAMQQFFGNTDSLLVKGGTLDQLEIAGKNLPQGQIPIFNSAADILSAASGKGPTAAYAAAILGVADDYSKVMGGTGGGSDTARSQALGLFAMKQSPEQRAGAINQVRQQVLSQRRGRVGTNPYLKDMYPEPEAAQAATAGAMPAGATHKVPGPDGKMHYTNAAGTVDLGVVQ